MSVRENVSEVQTGQIRRGGVAFDSVVRIGASRRTPSGRVKFRIRYRVGVGWDNGPEMYAGTIARRWPDVEEPNGG